jgi:hypothetical protein
MPNTNLAIRRIDKLKKINSKELNVEVKDLKSSVEEYAKFKFELQPQLETAKREIEINKSMLNMLNNEIQCLNTEKEELEKKIYNPKRIKTPCVAIQEEDEELESNNGNDNTNCKIEAVEDYLITEVDSYSGKLVTKCNEMDTLQVDQNIQNIVNLKKQIEEMTFYIDELKSDLEAEREKNSEYTSKTHTHCDQQDKLELNKSIDDSKASNSLINNSLEEFENVLNYYRKLNDQGDVKDWLENNSQKSSSNIIIEVNSVVMKIIHKYETELKKEVEQKKYIENQIEKLILNFKQEISGLEARLEEKINENDKVVKHFFNFKFQITFLCLMYINYSRMLK